MRSDISETRARILAAIAALPLGSVKLMEVCGTHTMAIARSGLRAVLPENVQLLSGPGCPVCVTPPEVIDAVLALAMRPEVIIAGYGDMLRVPGTRKGNSLARRRALGARVEIVYSPVDAVTLARNNPEKEVVFLGIGFETTAPGTAAAVLTAREEGVCNFSVWSMLKTVEPSLRALMAGDGFDISGFICPGHVASIIGARGFAFLPEEYNMPAVIAGFEAEDILLAVYRLLRQIAAGEAALENEYTRAVSPNGNALAQRIMAECFVSRRDIWRGLGAIDGSGLALAPALSAFDAERKFGIAPVEESAPTACRCGDVICGRMRAADCPLWGTACTPEEPVGPCMVSSEGACAAAYKYRGA